MDILELLAQKASEVVGTPRSGDQKRISWVNPTRRAFIYWMMDDDE